MARVAVYDTIFGATTIRQCVSTSLKPDSEIARDRQSGAYSASQISLVQSRPTASITTEDLKTILDDISAAGGASVAAGTITVPYQARATGGLFESGSNHETIAATHGHAVIQRITARQGDKEPAKGEVEIRFLSSDGLTAPISADTGQALAAQAFTGTYSLGPVAWNVGSMGALAELDKLTEVEIDFGHQVEVFAYGGDPYPTDVSVELIDPKIKVTFEDFAELQNSGLLGASITALDAFLRLRNDGGSYVADGNASHIKFSFTDGLSLLEDASAQAQKNGEASIVLEGKILAVSTASAIVLT